MTTKLFASLALLTLLALPALAADKSKGVSTMTKYVLQFGQMENAMLDAQSKHDTAALDALLSPLFEVRQASGERVSREDWLAAAKTAGGNASRPAQLAVYEVGNEAVANYWLGTPGAPGAEFVVDVWMPVDGKWLLRVRFLSPAH